MSKLIIMAGLCPHFQRAFSLSLYPSSEKRRKFRIYGFGFRDKTKSSRKSYVNRELGRINQLGFSLLVLWIAMSGVLTHD